jgi:hypothetical protein
MTDEALRELQPRIHKLYAKTGRQSGSHIFLQLRGRNELFRCNLFGSAPAEFSVLFVLRTAKGERGRYKCSTSVTLDS